jgi:hypothetical protein
VISSAGNLRKKRINITVTKPTGYKQNTWLLAVYIGNIGLTAGTVQIRLKFCHDLPMEL